MMVKNTRHNPSVCEPVFLEKVSKSATGGAK
jgi:hypothetical protein